MLVAQVLSTLDAHAEVVHNQRVQGELSGGPRQVDVLARGRVVGQPITVAVECKRHQRPMDVGVVDQFVGKLLDIGADRGVLYSYSGFTEGAARRAMSARNPSVVTVTGAIMDANVQACVSAPYPTDSHTYVEPPAVGDIDPAEVLYFLRTGVWSPEWI
jgi:Restriction endonuclease